MHSSHLQFLTKQADIVHFWVTNIIVSKMRKLNYSTWHSISPIQMGVYLELEYKYMQQIIIAINCNALYPPCPALMMNKISFL